MDCRSKYRCTGGTSCCCILTRSLWYVRRDTRPTVWKAHCLPGHEVVGAVLSAVLLDGDPGDCRLYRRHYLSVPVGREIQPEIQSWSDLTRFLAALPVKGSAAFHSATVFSSSSCRASLCSSFYSSWRLRSYIACLG